MPCSQEHAHHGHTPSATASCLVLKNICSGRKKERERDFLQVTASLHSPAERRSRYWMVYLEIGLWLSLPWLQIRRTAFSRTSSKRTPPGAPGGPGRKDSTGVSQGSAGWYISKQTNQVKKTKRLWLLLFFYFFLKYWVNEFIFMQGHTFCSPQLAEMFPWDSLQNQTIKM